MKLWKLNEQEWALVIENDVDASHPTVKMNTKTNLRTPDGTFSTIILRDESQAWKVIRETRPAKIDLSSNEAIRGWLKDANKTGLTGRAARHMEWIATGNTQAAREMAELLQQPWYIARAQIERDAKAQEA